MPPTRVLLLGLALLAAGLAGCLAGDTPGTSAAAAPEDAVPASQVQEDQDGSTSNATENGTAPSEDGTTTWKNQTRRGTFAGARALVGIFGTSETFPVADGALRLELVVRAPDASLTGSIDRGCECPDDDYETGNRVAFYSRDDPSAGDWTVTFFRDEPGAGSQSYVLEIARQYPASS